MRGASFAASMATFTAILSDTPIISLDAKFTKTLLCRVSYAIGGVLPSIIY